MTGNVLPQSKQELAFERVRAYPDNPIRL